MIAVLDQIKHIGSKLDELVILFHLLLFPGLVRCVNLILEEVRRESGNHLTNAGKNTRN